MKKQDTSKNKLPLREQWMIAIICVSLVAYLAGLVHPVTEWMLYLGIILTFEIPVMLASVTFVDWMIKKVN